MFSSRSKKKRVVNCWVDFSSAFSKPDVSRFSASLLASGIVVLSSLCALLLGIVPMAPRRSLQQLFRTDWAILSRMYYFHGRCEYLLFKRLDPRLTKISVYSSSSA